LVVRVWERVTSLGLADRVLVATDSREVADVVRAAGGEAVLTRSDHPSGTDRVAEAAAGHSADVILNVQGDEPFVSPSALQGAVAMVAEAQFDIGTAAVACSVEEAHAPSCVKVVCAADGRALYFSRALVPHLREPADAALQQAHLMRHVGVYAYRAEALARWVSLPVHPLEQCERLEQLRPLAHGLTIGVSHVADAGSAGIDTEADLAAANVRWTTPSSRTSSPHLEGAR
jgi:3-deoxy-manno-octulosonate cytidylyltransferase (CMP-KDO synthetase)